jgi:hypothetical protein
METPKRIDIRRLIETLLQGMIGNRVVMAAPRSTHNERHASLERRNSDAPRMAEIVIPA